MATLDATFTVEADDARTAADVGLNQFCEAAKATGIPPTEIVDLRSTLAASAEHDEQLTGDLVAA